MSICLQQNIVGNKPCEVSPFGKVPVASKIVSRLSPDLSCNAMRSTAWNIVAFHA